MGQQCLTITDERTGRTYRIPISDHAVRAEDLSMIGAPEEGVPNLVVFDPSLRYTAPCRSAITYLDGRSGVLRYRGYPIEELARQSTYLEVAYLVYHGELPGADELRAWQRDVADNYLIHENIKRFIDGFRHDAHPMGVLVSTVAALSTFFPDASNVEDPECRRRQAVRLLGQVPTLAAFAYRRSHGMPYAYPDMDLSYTGNFLNMIFRMTELKYEPNPVVESVLDLMFILHADHEQACSTTTMRCVGSARSDPYSAAAAAAAALYGRFHTEAYEAVLNMLREIGTPDRIPAFLDRVRREKRSVPGFGHRVYRTLDPRARILREEAARLFTVTGRPPLFDLALELDARTESDPYFQERGLRPFVDFYEAILYHAMGFPTQMFPVLFAIPRFIGWVAQWNEMMSEPRLLTYRPTQIYTGPWERHYVPLDQR